MKKKFKNAAPPHPIVFVLGIFSKFFLYSDFLSHKFRTLGEIADYIIWLKKNFSKTKIFIKRESLWRENLKVISEYRNNRSSLINNETSLLIIELGVAWGYAANWHVKKLNQYNYKYMGFDLFTGLPRAWRDQKLGAFNADGRIPEINDQRVSFIKGDVSKTIKEIDYSVLKESQLLILFDLDIYEPSKVAFDHLSQFFKSGDVIYFDEAFDSDERKLIQEEILEREKVVGGGKSNFKLIGATSLACSFVFNDPEVG